MPRWSQEDLDRYEQRARVKKSPAPEDPGAATVVEYGAGNVAVAEAAPKTTHRPRFLVRIVSVRKRLIDEDNLCSKYHVDLCRYAGALPSDAPGVCQIQTSQRKPFPGEEEHILITIDEVNNEPHLEAGNHGQV